uniref:Uncharacterized protein n=1 Tax=Rhizophora mucronata TaxID=61149 RepID=A0A2P2NA42_RHIMU
MLDLINFCCAPSTSFMLKNAQAKSDNWAPYAEDIHIILNHYP